MREKKKVDLPGTSAKAIPPGEKLETRPGGRRRVCKGTNRMNVESGEKSIGRAVK